MRRKSHMQLGKKLVDIYFQKLPTSVRHVFLFGCIQPDMNPFTFCKGSIREESMHGHNYENACTFFYRIAGRLEQKKHLNLWDWYTLGKLMHYTADAFTYPHNNCTGMDLIQHRLYEVRLQEYFLSQLTLLPVPDCTELPEIPELVKRNHNAYLNFPGCPEQDTVYSFSVCCLIAAKMQAKAGLPLSFSSAV